MSDRYRKEIEEILRQAGELGPNDNSPSEKPGFIRSMWQKIKKFFNGGWSITPGRIMLVAVALLLSALIVNSLAPGLVGFLGWTGLALFILGYALFFIRPRRGWMGGKLEKKWRGRIIEDDARSPWWKRLRH